MDAKLIIKQCLRFTNNLLNKEEIKELIDLFDTNLQDIENCIIEGTHTNSIKLRQQMNIIAQCKNKIVDAKDYNALYNDKPKGAVFYILNTDDSKTGMTRWVTNNDSDDCLKTLKSVIKEGELKMISTARTQSENGVWGFDIKLEWDYDPTRPESVAYTSTILVFKKKENRDASFQYLMKLNIKELKISKEKRDALANALILSLKNIKLINKNKIVKPKVYGGSYCIEGK